MAASWWFIVGLSVTDSWTSVSHSVSYSTVQWCHQGERIPANMSYYPPPYEICLTDRPLSHRWGALELSTSTQSHQSLTRAIKGCMHCCSSPYHTFTHALQLCYQTGASLIRALAWLLSASIREYLMQDLLHVNCTEYLEQFRHPNVSDSVRRAGNWGTKDL